MKDRLTIIGVIVVLAISIGLALLRRPASVPLSFVSARTSTKSEKAVPATAPPEVNPAAEQPAPDGPEPTGPVPPLPRARHVAALEEPPPVGAEKTATAPEPTPGPGPNPEAAAVENDDATPPAPATLLENVRSAFRLYSTRFGGNPVGDNAEITAALNGGNPSHVIFLNHDDGLRMGTGGQMVDSWGTPLFFHQLSRTETEIRSAGPDRKMWTSDDLILK